MYTIRETDRELQIVGSCFIDEIVTSKQITVIGDLVATAIRAPRIVVTNGTLACPRVDAIDGYHGDILGVYQLDRPFAAPQGCTFSWLRPIKTQLTAKDDRFADTIIRSLFTWPEIAWDTLPYAYGDALTGGLRPALEVLRDSAVLTLLGRQVVECFLAHENLPSDWRW